MAKLIHPREQTVFFVTTSCFRAQTFFRTPEAAELVIEQIDRLRKKGVWLVSEYVVMPDHVHLITFPIRSLGYCLQELKKSVARLLNLCAAKSGRKIWIDEYYEKAIGNEREYAAIVEYIWYNPVKAGLVAKPELFKFGSAAAFRKTDRDRFI